MKIDTSNEAIDRKIHMLMNGKLSGFEYEVGLLLKALKEERNELKYTIDHAFTYPDGDYLTLEELGNMFFTLVKEGK